MSCTKSLVKYWINGNSVLDAVDPFIPHSYGEIEVIVRRRSVRHYMCEELGASLEERVPHTEAY
jgi:hypothetical protein